MKNRKTLWIRAAFVAALLAVAALMMVIGRGHTVYLDNVPLTYGDTVCAAPYRAVVLVKGERVARLDAKDRGMCTWIGQNFKMTLQVTEEKGGEEATRELSVKLPYRMDGVILNLPGLLAGLPQEAWLTEFVAVPTAEEMQEEEPEGGGDLLMDVDTEF